MNTTYQPQHENADSDTLFTPIPFYTSEVEYVRRAYLKFMDGLPPHVETVAEAIKQGLRSHDCWVDLLQQEQAHCERCNSNKHHGIPVPAKTGPTAAERVIAILERQGYLTSTHLDHAGASTRSPQPQRSTHERQKPATDSHRHPPRRQLGPGNANLSPFGRNEA